MELAFNDLILLGNAEQVELAQLTVRQTQEDGTLYFNPLMSAIRDDLRGQLGLANVELEEGVLYFEVRPPDRSKGSQQRGGRATRMTIEGETIKDRA